MLLSHFSCVRIGVMCSGHTNRKWSNFKSFLVYLRRQPLWQRPRPVSGKDIMQCTFHELHCPSCNDHVPNRQLFSSCNSIFAVEDRQRQKASRFSRIARIIRLRQYDAEFINQMGSLTSNISIANMPHTRANQIPTSSIPFRMGIRLTAISEPVPGIWRLVRTGAEARG
jgi:hypothetical protein